MIFPHIDIRKKSKYYKKKSINSVYIEGCYSYCVDAINAYWRGRATSYGYWNIQLEALGWATPPFIVQFLVAAAEFAKPTLVTWIAVRQLILAQAVSLVVKVPLGYTEILWLVAVVVVVGRKKVSNFLVGHWIHLDESCRGQ
jgi:hypothetical protein